MMRQMKKDDEYENEKTREKAKLMKAIISRQ